jgi:hypothetical protein
MYFRTSKPDKRLVMRLKREHVLLRLGIRKLG